MTLAVLSFANWLVGFAITVRTGIKDMDFEHGYLLSSGIKKTHPKLNETSSRWAMINAAQ
jgi:hypothetical protein